MENQKMKTSTIVWIVIAILVITGGTLAYSKYGKPGAPEVLSEDIDNTPQMRITAKHQFKGGLPAQAGRHIVAGEVDLPTPCYILKTDSVVRESSPEQVTIAFTTTTSGEVCAQVVTSERFKTEFTASSGAVINATWNGKPAILNLIPAGANEDLSNFELFIKG